MNRQYNYGEIIMHKTYECTVYYKVTIPEIDFERKDSVDLDSFHSYYTPRRRRNSEPYESETRYVWNKKNAVEFIKSHCDGDRLCFEPMPLDMMCRLSETETNRIKKAKCEYKWKVKIIKVEEHYKEPEE